MKKLLLLAIGVGLFASCNKNLNSEDSIDASRQRNLMDKAWQLKAYTINPRIYDTTSVALDKYLNMQDCEKDNYLIFNTESAVSKYDHYKKCLLSDPDTIPYSYSLTKDEKYITIWSNPADPAHSTVLYGNITYPSTDSFIIEHKEYDAVAETTSEHIKVYVKMIPD